MKEADRVAKEINLLAGQLGSDNEVDLESLHEEFLNLGKWLDKLDDKHRRAVVAVLSERIWDALEPINAYIDMRLAHKRSSGRKGKKVRRFGRNRFAPRI